jgi:hypothetical protein
MDLETAKTVLNQTLLDALSIPANNPKKLQELALKADATYEAAFHHVLDCKIAIGSCVSRIQYLEQSTGKQKKNQ